MGESEIDPGPMEKTKHEVLDCLIQGFLGFKAWHIIKGKGILFRLRKHDLKVGEVVVFTLGCFSFQ